MNVLIVTEKPAISRCIAPFARDCWPTASIALVHAQPYSNLRFAYPRGLKRHDFPLVSEPQDRLVSWGEWHCAPFALTADGTPTPVVISEALFTSADLIVCACGVDHTGAVGFEAVIQRTLGEGRALACPALPLFALDDASIATAFAQMSPFGDLCSRSLEYGRIKRYFDWNWNVNSLAILGETQRSAGVPTDAPPLSKNALQLLYALRNLPPISEGDVIRLMSRWPGTGKYSVEPGVWRPEVGSSASKAQILENLTSAGLLDVVRGPRTRPVLVSARGRTLLELLHPDCEDADLPFRLHAWCEQGASARPAIDRYIKSFFGKQKRFLAKN